MACIFFFGLNELLSFSQNGASISLREHLPSLRERNPWPPLPVRHRIGRFRQAFVRKTTASDTDRFRGGGSEPEQRGSAGRAEMPLLLQVIKTIDLCLAGHFNNCRLGEVRRDAERTASPAFAIGAMTYPLRGRQGVHRN